MDEHDKIQMIPYIAFESAQARNERIVQKLIFSLITVIVMLFVSNIIWVYEWTRYDYESGEEVTLDAGDGGNANYIGNNGEVRNYGTNYSE